MCQITPVKTFISLTWQVFQSIFISARFAFSVLVSTVFSPVNRAFPRKLQTLQVSWTGHQCSVSKLKHNAEKLNWYDRLIVFVCQVSILQLLAVVH